MKIDELKLGQTVWRAYPSEDRVAVVSANVRTASDGWVFILSQDSSGHIYGATVRPNDLHPTRAAALLALADRLEALAVQARGMATQDAPGMGLGGEEAEP